MFCTAHTHTHRCSCFDYATLHNLYAICFKTFITEMFAQAPKTFAIVYATRSVVLMFNPVTVDFLFITLALIYL